MTMKTEFNVFAVLLFFLFVSSSAIAAKPIAKCVNSQGELTFTDYFCETAEPGHNPLLMNETAINPTVRAKIPSVVKAETIADSSLKSATSEAQSQCEQRFVNYFKRKHPSINSVPEVQFSQIVDQFIKGTNISISLIAPVEYQDDTYSINANIECTVQRFKANSDWVIGFREN